MFSCVNRSMYLFYQNSNRKDHGLPLANITLCQINYDTDCQDNPHNYFESFDDTYYGQCLRFNSGKKLNGDSIDLIKAFYGAILHQYIFFKNKIIAYLARISF